MPYKDLRKQRAYQTNWTRQRRDEWLAANGPCRQCGSWDDLEVDHIDPNEKTSHRVWSWSKEKRDAELAKCQPLCACCHQAKTSEMQRRPITHGTRSGYNRGCRCVECRGYVSAKNRDYRARAPQPPTRVRCCDCMGVFTHEGQGHPFHRCPACRSTIAQRKEA